MTQMNKFVQIVSLLCVIGPTVALAQVPTRPGLDVKPPNYGGQVPQTTLVQRNYNSNGAIQGAPVLNGQSQRDKDLFYVGDKSKGPENLTKGLDNYNSNRMTQAGQQLSGDYGAMQRSGEATGPGSAFPEGKIQDAWKRPLDNMSQGQNAPASITYQWSPDFVMQVRLRTGMVTSIVLPEWEGAQDVVIGDGSTVEATIVRPNQIAVKSMRVGLDTSMHVVGGSGNVYTFYLRTEGRNTEVLTDLQVFVKASPADGSSDWFDKGGRGWFSSEARDVLNNKKVSDSDVEHVGASIHLSGVARHGNDEVPVDRRVYNVKMFAVNDGDEIIAPEYVYTDGRFTYLHFAFRGDG